MPDRSSESEANMRRWMYVALTCGFIAFHVTHTGIVYARNHAHHATTGVRSND